MQKLKARESIRKGAFQRVQSSKQYLGDEEIFTEQTKEVHQLPTTHLESTVSSRSSDDIDQNSDSQNAQRWHSSTRKKTQSRREFFNGSPNMSSDEDDPESIVGSPQSDNGVPDDANKEYPSWTRCSFKPWNEPDEPNELEYIPSVTDEDVHRFSTIMQGDQSTTCHPTQERMEDNDSDDDASVVSSASSNESDSSDLDSLDIFLKKMFGCSAQQEFATKDNDLVMNNDVVQDKINNLNGGDRNNEDHNIDPEETGSKQGSVHKMDSSDAIYTSNSSPSRRRSYKGRSVLSVDDMSLSAVDSVIEMTNSQEETFLMGTEEDSDIVDEERDPDDSYHARNSENDSVRTTEDYIKHVGDDDRDEQITGCTYPPSEKPISNDETKEPAMPSSSTPEWHGMTMGTTDYRPQKDHSSRGRGKTSPFWAAITHPRAPNIIRDQVTMLPDNLTPMARLRYCRESISTAMYV